MYYITYIKNLIVYPVSLVLLVILMLYLIQFITEIKFNYFSICKKILIYYYSTFISTIFILFMFNNNHLKFKEAAHFDFGPTNFIILVAMVLLVVLLITNLLILILNKLSTLHLKYISINKIFNPRNYFITVVFIVLFNLFIFKIIQKRQIQFEKASQYAPAMQTKVAYSKPSIVSPLIRLSFSALLKK